MHRIYQAFFMIAFDMHSSGVEATLLKRQIEGKLNRI